MIFGPHINNYYKRYWYLFVIGFFCLILVDIVQLLVPMLIGDMIQHLGREAVNGVSPFDRFNTLAITWNGRWFDMTLGYMLLAVGLIGFLITVGRIGWRITVLRVGSLIECDMREKMFNHMQSLSISWFAKEKTGGLMAYFTNDLEDIKECCSQGVIFVVDVFVLGIASLVFMFMTHWLLAILCLIPIAGILAVSFYLMRNGVKLWDKSQYAFQTMSDLAQESITGLAVVKAFVREKRELERFSKTTREMELKNMNYIRFEQKWGVAIEYSLIFSTELLIIAVGCWLALSNDIALPGIGSMTTIEAAGVLTKFFGYFSALLWPLQAITMLIDLMSRGKASLLRISKILDTKNDLMDSSNLYDGKVKGDVEYRNLSFHYPDNASPVLENISFKIKAGQNIGIVGKTGSGKSSLLSLLLKLYNIPRGMIYIDGKDINDWYGKALREDVGYVSQDAFLFSDTIEGNIAFGSDHPTVDKIRKSAQFADVDENIKELPNGYETLVGERGKSVSGGQRQRISMARAIAKDPSILVLDDSVSAVDAITEKKILENIKQQRKGRTTFIISSRLSAVENLDGILVIDHGHLIGFGTHEELLESCSLYKKLYEMQLLKKELA